MATNVVAVFDDREDAQRSVHELVNNGFSRDEISVIASNPQGKLQQQAVDEGGTLADEGAIAGTTTGAAVGGVIGLLAGIGLGFVPFLGFLVAGPVAGLITGAAAGALTGGLLGGLIGLGIPESEAHTYAESVRRGGTLVMVRCANDAECDRAEDILERFTPVDVEERAASYRESGWSGYDPNAPHFEEHEVTAERDRFRSRNLGGAGTMGATGAVTNAGMGSQLNPGDMAQPTNSDMNRSTAAGSGGSMDDANTRMGEMDGAAASTSGSTGMGDTTSGVRESAMNANTRMGTTGGVRRYPHGSSTPEGGSGYAYADEPENRDKQ